MKIRAAIARQAEQDFTIEECELSEPGSGELLIRVEACGICHTDIAARDQDMPVPLPAVLGHEGVGTVEQVGEGVEEFAPGDRILVSFGSCGACPNCVDQAPGYCDLGMVYMTGSRPDGRVSLHQNGEPITSHFFAQSTMATHAVVSSRNVVKLDPQFPIEVAAPLACGVQTGAGTVLLAMQAKAGKAIAVAGCGTVGLSAIMAAKIAGCSQIIAIDLVEERLELAKELGATAVIAAGKPLAESLLELGGVDYAFDTTGVSAVALGLFDGLKARGMLVCSGIGKPGATLNLDMTMLMATGRHVRGVIEGDAVPRSFIPQLIQYHQEGVLPVEKLVKTYPFEAVNEAVADSLSGEVVKPVLLMQ